MTAATPTHGNRAGAADATVDFGRVIVLVELAREAVYLATEQDEPVEWDSAGAPLDEVLRLLRDAA